MSDIPEEIVEEQPDTLPAPEEEGDHDQPEDWMMSARHGGSSWEDIGRHVSESTESAFAGGNTQDDVDKYLGYKPNQNARGWMERAWDSVFGATPPDGKLDLNSPTLRSDYAHALTEGTVKDAKDFADTYAAAALDAAKKHGDVDDNHRRQAAAAAEGLAQGLPDRHDFVDAAMSVTDTPENAERVRKELVNRWKETGKSPYDLVKTETDLNKHTPSGDDPGLVGRLFLNTTSGIVGIADGILGAPHALAGAGDWALEKLGAAKGEGLITQYTDINKAYSFEDHFRKGMDVIDKVFGGNGLNLTAHSTPEALATEFLSFGIPTVAATLASGGTSLIGAAGQGARIGAYVTAAHQALNQIFPDGDRVGDVVKLLAMGTIAHIASRKPISHFSPDESGAPAIKPIPIEEYTRDNIAHEEAQLTASHPSFLSRLMSDESGQFTPGGEGGDYGAERLALRRAADVTVGERVANPIDAGHYSPHDFDKFSTDYLGTGEADRQKGQDIADINRRGNGLYFWTNHDIGNFYKGTLSVDKVGGRPYDILNPEHQAAMFKSIHGDKAVSFLEDESKGARSPVETQALDVLKSGRQLPEYKKTDINDYRVKLHVDQDKLLDLDKPVKGEAERLFGVKGEPPKEPVGTNEKPVTPEQTEAYHVQMNEWRDKLDEHHLDQYDVDKAGYTTGQQWFDRLSKRLGGTKNATDFLSNKGVHGTKYLDAASRGGEENPTHNYVVFRDGRVEMAKKNGEVIKTEDTRKEINALAEGYHTTENLLGSWLSNVKAVMGSDSGALNLSKIMDKLPQWYGPSARESIAFDQSRSARRVLTSSWTKSNAGAKQWKTYVQAQLDKTGIGTFVSKNLKEAQDAMALPDAADRATAFRKSQLGQLEMAINGQIPIAPNHPLYEPVAFMKRIRDFMHMEGTQWHLDGFLPKTEYVKGYTQGLWENPNAKWEETHDTSRNPFGDTRYLKDKTYQDKFQGIQAGEIPKYLDPVQHLAHEVMNHAKQSIKMNMLQDLTKAFPGSPVGMQDTANPPQFLMPLKDTQYGNKAAYAPKGFAEKWNSQFDAGLLSDPFQERTLTSLQKVVGVVNNVKLLWPMFHMRTMMMATWADTMHEVETAGLGMIKGAFTGDMPMVADQTYRALKSLALGIPVIPKIINQVGVKGLPFIEGKGREGFKWYTDTDPMVGKSVKALTDDEIHESIRNGGFGYSRGMENMVGHEPSLHKSILRNIDRNDSVIGNIKNQARAFAQTQREKWNNDWGVGTDESVARRGINASYRLPAHVVEETARLGQTFGHFAFDYLIPRMQYGAIYESAASWRARNPGYTPKALDEFVRSQILDQENRKGELNMVNVFWPAAWKQSASLAMLSTGWKFGTFRGLAQTAGWDPDQGRWRTPLLNNPTATMSTINSASSWMMMNALHQYINTGTLPTQTDTPWQDLALFRTGTTGKRMGDEGIVARGMNPGEPKEIYDLAHILFTALGNPSKTGAAISEYAMAATNPLWQAVRAGITGEDAIGHKVGEQPGGWSRFLQAQFLPMFSDSNILDRKDSGIPFWEQKWLGTREAASWAENPAGYDRFLKEQRAKDEKSELKRARKEIETYQNTDWLKQYADEKEAMMKAGGTGVTAGGSFHAPTVHLSGAPRKKKGSIF